MAELWVGFQAIDTHFDSLGSQLDRMGERMDHHATRLDGTERWLSEMEDDLVNIMKCLEKEECMQRQL
ncbi:hypothetical protein NDU88_002131 [Pleurodeles waltl]|uniref:Uncharacterized protein n=1 Tax=Pleurodeles waltl TaxID=8319 RepID=A0AAV7Q528_PLEWA|nr:hypothetical protein NDU88_002131 [Pleurodeles waltl]